jgi:hypothetical protein
MPRGGARVRSGPPPDPNALRRERDADQWDHLPEGGRQSDPPPWPLAKPTVREKTLWAREWQRPQAVMWEREHLEEEVAVYVRAMYRFEGPKHQAADGTLMRMLADDLGISMSGLAKHRWIIGGAGASAPAAAPRKMAAGSARERFGVIDGGA